MKAPCIAAFDIATVTGVCYGRVGSKPQLETWDLKEGGGTRARRLLYLHCLLRDLFNDNKEISIVRYERPMPIIAAVKVGATEQVVQALRGAVGIVEMTAAQMNIVNIGDFYVHEARMHLIGHKPPKGEGKTEVFKMCRMLGVNVRTDHEADAYAGWSLACALTQPGAAHLTTPLFTGRQQCGGRRKRKISSASSRKTVPL